jgi:hypothetical protein
MGVFLPNAVKRVETVFNGRVQRSLVPGSLITDGKLLEIVEGREEGSKLDGSEYVVARVQVKPGQVIRVTGYGAEEIASIRKIGVGGSFSSFNTKVVYGGCKLVEFQAPTAPAETPQQNAA